MAELYCALDGQEKGAVEGLARLLAPAVDGIKIGLEYFCAHGPEGAAGAQAAAGRPLFLDLKMWRSLMPILSRRPISSA